MDFIFPIAVTVLLIVGAVLWCVYIYKKRGKGIEYAAALAITCVTVLSVLVSDFKTDKEPYCPEVGRVLFTISCESVQDEDKWGREFVYPLTSVVLYKGETVYDVLNRLSTENKFVVENGGTPLEAYIMAMGGIVSGKNGGENSYWTYYINGVEQSISCDKYVLHPGDKVLWYFVECE